MHRLLSGTVLVVSLWLASVAATATACLPDLGMPDLDYPAFERGAIFQLFLTETLWQKYPSLPLFPILFHAVTPAFLILYGGAYYLFCRCGNVRPLIIGVIGLVSGIVPYLAARWVLAQGQEFETVAYWMETLFSGFLLSTTICAVFAALDLWRQFSIRTGLAEPSPACTAETSQSIAEEVCVTSNV